MTNVLQFPSDVVTPEDVLRNVEARLKEGRVKHILVVTMGPDTDVKTAMSTTPAHSAVYMNQLQRMSIEDLMREKDMVP